MSLTQLLGQFRATLFTVLGLGELVGCFRRHGWHLSSLRTTFFHASLSARLRRVSGTAEHDAGARPRAGLSLERHLAVDDRVVDAHGTLHQPSLAAGEIMY